MDYMQLTREAEKEGITCMTMAEDKWGELACFYVRTKGGQDGYPVVAGAAWLDNRVIRRWC